MTQIIAGFFCYLGGDAKIQLVQKDQDVRAHTYINGLFRKQVKGQALLAIKLSKMKHVLTESFS